MPSKDNQDWKKACQPLASLTIQSLPKATRKKGLPGQKTESRCSKPTNKPRAAGQGLTQIRTRRCECDRRITSGEMRHAGRMEALPWEPQQSLPWLPSSRYPQMRAGSQIQRRKSRDQTLIEPLLCAKYYPGCFSILTTHFWDWADVTQHLHFTDEESES